MQAHLTEHAVREVSTRLAGLPLRLPPTLGATDSQQVLEYLTALLERDPGVFLERYGTELSAQELKYFEALRGDYEVDFYMKQQEDALKGSRGVTVRNRRLARMNRLEAEGEFFTEEAMRARAPLLHEQYMGTGSAPVQPPTAGRDTFDRLEREALLQEQRVADMKGARPVRSMEEEEEEEEEEGVDEDEEAAARRPRLASEAVREANGGSMPGRQEEEEPPGAAAGQGAEEGGSRADLEMLLSIMKARFLAGEDGGVDYKAVDADASLDDDWAAVASQDAQERYFDAA